MQPDDQCDHRNQVVLSTDALEQDDSAQDRDDFEADEDSINPSVEMPTPCRVRNKSGRKNN